MPNKTLRTLNKLNKLKIHLKIKMSQKNGLNFVRLGPNKSKTISLSKTNLSLSKLPVIFYYNSENSRKVEKQVLSTSTLLNHQPQQKISDRIQ